jgi:hypothetical protein
MRTGDADALVKAPRAVHAVDGGRAGLAGFERRAGRAAGVVGNQSHGTLFLERREDESKTRVRDTFVICASSDLLVDGQASASGSAPAALLVCGATAA